MTTAGLPSDTSRFGDWIGELPPAWRTLQIKNLGVVTLGKMIQPGSSGPDDVLSPYLRAANVQPDGVLAISDIKSMWFSPTERAALDLHRGDVVVVEGGIGGYGRAAYVHESLPQVGFQNSINRIRPGGECDGRFLTYCLIAARQRGFIAAYCNIVSMPHFTAEKLASMKVPAPPYERQQQIADFLDRETARIDTLIDKLQHLIDTLRERKQVATEQMLVNFDNPARRLRLVCAEIDSRAGANADSLPLLAVSIHRGVVLRDSSTTNQSASEDLSNYKLVRRGDIVVNRMRAFQGGVGESPADGIVSPDYMVMRVGDGASSGWLGLLMRTPWFVGEMTARIRGIGSATQGAVRTPRINPADLLGIEVPTPDVSDQMSQTQAVKLAVGRIDVLIERAQSFIELSKERRSALITAAVTGQIDLRGTTTEGAA